MTETIDYLVLRLLETFLSLFDWIPWWGLLAISIGLLLVVAIIGAIKEQRRIALIHPDQRSQQLLTQQWGNLNPKMICPHCQCTGSVRTKPTSQKKGISGGKVTAAVLTAGISILATGLSRKENLTQAFCSNCQNRWFF
jgi:hypothetical protein